MKHQDRGVAFRKPASRGQHMPGQNLCLAHTLIGKKAVRSLYRCLVLKCPWNAPTHALLQPPYHCLQSAPQTKIRKTRAEQLVLNGSLASVNSRRKCRHHPTSTSPFLFQ